MRPFVVSSRSRIVPILVWSERARARGGFVYPTLSGPPLLVSSLRSLNRCAVRVRPVTYIHGRGRSRTRRTRTLTPSFEEVDAFSFVRERRGAERVSEGEAHFGEDTEKSDGLRDLRRSIGELNRMLQRRNAESLCLRLKRFFTFLNSAPNVVPTT